MESVGTEDLNSSTEEEPIEVEEFPVPSQLQDTNEFVAEQETLDLIYKWYVEAISRRGRDPLAQDRFEYHFFRGGSHEKTYMYGDIEKGFILGFWKHGIFIPTHFAPKSIRGGYTLFQELAKSKEIPVVGVVTEDLSNTLKKMMGWKSLRISLLAYLNDNLVDKVVIYNSYPKIWRRMWRLIKELKEETRRLREESEEWEDSSPDENDE